MVHTYAATAASGMPAAPSTRPIVSFVVPCYNSAAYMRTCIDSLVPALDCCEAIIVNDGSTDATLAIAREYETAYPDSIRVIDQENAGWGGGINNGLACARGMYFKVVDSDDWLDVPAFNRVLDVLKAHATPETAFDLVFSNFVYDHVTDGTKHAIRYDGLMPQDRPFGWEEFGKPRVDQYIMVHATWYRTDLLRESGVTLPTNVCYMDGYLMLHPLPLVKRLYYVNADVYHYLIGREDQSIGIETVKKRIDQQLLTTRLCIGDHDFNRLKQQDPPMAELYARYVSAMMSVSTIHLFMIGTPEAIAKNRELWAYMKRTNPALHARVARSLAGFANRRTALFRKAAVAVFSYAQRKYKFA